MLCRPVLGVQSFVVQSNSFVELLPSIASGLALFAIAGAILAGLVWLPLQIWRRKVQRRGYPGLKAYLHEVPQTPEAKLDAVELTMKGVVICILGLMFPPLCLVGLVPLYYGARKLAAMSLLRPGVDDDKRTQLS